MQFPERLRRYFVGVALAGLIAGVYLVVRTPAADARVVLVVAAFVFAAESQQRVMPSGAGLSITDAAVVSALWIFGPTPALVGTLLGYALTAWSRASNGHVLAFNGGVSALAVALAECVHRAALGLPLPWGPWAGLLLAVLAYELVGFALVSGGMAIARRQPFAAVAAQHLAESVVPWLGAAAAVSGVVGVERLWGPWVGIAAAVFATLLHGVVAQWTVWVRSRLARDIVARLRAEGADEDPRTQLAVHYATSVAAELGLSPDQQAVVREAALLHDLAMELALPGVLSSTEELAEGERAAMRRHPEIAAREIARIADLAPVAEAVRHHHESWSGGGYPGGLSGAEIPIPARILAVVDTYLAVAEPRPYRGGPRGPAAGLEAVASERGRRLWPPAVDALRSVVTRELAQDTLMREADRRYLLPKALDRLVESLVRPGSSRYRFADRGALARHRWQAVHEFTQVMNSSLSPGEVADRLLEVLTRLSGSGGLVAVVGDDERYTIRAVRRAGADLVGRPFHLADPALAATLAAGRHTFVNLRRQGEWALPFARLGLAYGCLVPARWGGRLVAIVLLAANRPFFDEEAQMAEMAASQAALALSNAVLYEALERSLEEVRELHQLTDAVLESMNAAVLVFDESRRLVRVNREARRLAERIGIGELGPGLSMGELAARAGLSLRAARRLFPRAGAREGGEPAEWRVAGERGEAHVTATAARIVGPLGRRLGTVVVCQDVSEVVRLRAEVAESERLAAVGQMAATASHEIRNPLAAVKGFLQMVAADPTPARMTRYLPTVLAELTRIERLTSDMLLLARPAAPAGAECDVADELRQVALLARPRAEAQGVALDLRVASVPLRVPLEAARARQVLWNLVQNALEAMPGGGRLTLAAEADDGAVTVVVRDTGPGIDPAVMGRLFEPFVTTKPTGTGLGLATTASLVEGAGGRIEVESTRGGGTAFILRFAAPAEGRASHAPLARAPGRAARLALARPEAAGEGAAQV